MAIRQVCIAKYSLAILRPCIAKHSLVIWQFFAKYLLAILRSCFAKHLFAIWQHSLLNICWQFGDIYCLIFAGDLALSYC
jgi:hypothetical protein